MDISSVPLFISKFLPDGYMPYCLTLFFTSFVQEDFAVLTGGVFVINKELPLLFAFLSLYLGIIISDIGIYGLGVAARSIPWTQKYLLNSNVQYAKKKIEKGLIPSVSLCRLCPGLLFPTFVACGWLGIPFLHFTLITVVAAAVYAVTLLFLITTIGAPIVHQIGTAGWVILLGVSISVIIFKSTRASKMRLKSTNSKCDQSSETLSLSGMPSYSWKNNKVALSEKIPPILFYAPVVIQWLILGIRYRSLTLPTISNPHVEAGGLWGESKSDLLNQISDEYQTYVAKFITVSRKSSESNDFKTALSKLKDASIPFPLVAKPDIGWQGYGVRLIDNEDELREYIASYPLKKTIILQKYIPHSGEAGVFYIRIPGEEHGCVTSLTLRYYPHVTGDGVSTVKELIHKDERTRHKLHFFRGNDDRHAGITPEILESVPKEGEKIRLAFIGSLRVGGTYRDGSNFITSALTERFDKIAKSMPPFYFGRFDIRFESIDKLQKGEGFSIIEINGAGSEAIHIWDIDKSLPVVYKELFKYQSLLFKISALNRKNGFKKMGIANFVKYSMHYNSLVHNYPRSE